MGTPTGGQRGVVLVVDDDPMLRLLLVDTLKGSVTDEVLEATDGLDAQRVLSESDVDVVITDLIMPNMGGLELLQWARDHCTGPVWMVNSGVDTFEMAAEALDLGVFAFLPKPRVSLDAVRMTVRRALEHRALQRESVRLTEALRISNRRLTRKVDQLEALCGLLQHQAHAIEHDLSRAEAIQRALLPRRTPTVVGLSINGFYRACRHVGGDLYDVVRLGPNKIGFYIADAAGHGVTAAMLSVLFQNRLRVMDSRRRARSPSDVLRSVNDKLTDECSRKGLFVTAAYGVLDVATGRLLLSSAGHPPAIVRRVSGDVELLANTGPALGIEARPRFGEWCVDLVAGDRLLLFTDGLLLGHGQVEASPEQIAARLADTALSGQPLLHSLHPEQGALDDDVTLLLMGLDDTDSALDNGSEESGPWITPPPMTEEAQILRGLDGGDCWICVRGRGTWSHASAFLKCCEEALDEGLAIVVDLSGCTWLDSTFLGTLHEAVGLATRRGLSMSLQRVDPDLRDMFVELHLSAVIEHMGSDPAPLPGLLEPVDEGPVKARDRVLAAHEALAAIDEHNRQEFEAVIEAVRNDNPGT